MTIEKFVAESNHIEGIHREPTEAEIIEAERFFRLEKLTVSQLEMFVRTYQPDARLRERTGMDVFVGHHVPPRGGPHIRMKLEKFLADLKPAPVVVSTNKDDHPYFNHLVYEHLHPFTDGNGRSGRMIWAWQMGRSAALKLGFLHLFYYQALASFHDTKP